MYTSFVFYCTFSNKNLKSENLFITGLNHTDNLISYFYKNVLLSKTSYMSANISKIIENLVEELLTMREHNLEANLDNKEIKFMLENVSCLR